MNMDADLKKIVLECIEEDITVGEIADKLGLNNHICKYILMMLEKQGTIISKKRGKHNLWRLRNGMEKTV